ncbi:WXG100 family type VII secretion target [Lentzea sp. NPDC042327]|uniref:WXG100 family type VII secretion target n=1 Tax=Lentzea sp. NPDC042327 TaxID=3154801 RepID=UPI0033D842CA
MGEIKVEFGQIAQAASTITTQSKEIDGVLDEIRAEVVRVLGTWEGEGSDTYKQSQEKWDNAAADLNSVLAAIGTAVQQAGEAYQQAEKQNVSRW